jgi:hypothetical protein
LTAAAIGVMLVHVAIGLVDLPRFWGKPEHSGEVRAVVILLLLSLSLTLLTVFQIRPPSLLAFVRAAVIPLGDMLFAP